MYRKQAKSARRGFTLAEMVVVVLILGIMASVAALHWVQVLEQTCADNTARRIIADLGKVQGLAFITSRTQTMTFVLDANRYSLEGLPDPDGPSSTYTVDLSGSPYRAHLVSVDLAGGPALSFNGFGQPMGLPAAGGRIVVAVGDLQYTIAVDATTGAATLQ